ncbi:phosphoadenylyl-sulfate reductase [Pseudoroseomonas cervicalis]|uniref:phosphoadenylyl-sulfate reductase n=1 Tax=Teichococcus cervicalis TaxID=204525 RepID=UPI002780154E|nr:phosphoadenylyl-sulfate reductase [Pseudoroseomonas cervicalis]MDQ1078871.1 phosphoadenosine phosphosulfate reductase [Pseudoroseomonas cervicalis]
MPDALATAASPPPAAVRRAAEIEAALQRRGTAEGLAWLATRFRGELALVSSFGAEAAVLLHLAARADPAIPVLFLDTGKLFPETLAYRDRLAARLGLRDLRSLRPEAAALAGQDPLGGLWASDADRCCALRKVAPLRAALRGFTVWLNGRKRFHAAGRVALRLAEATPEGQVSVAPLAGWGAAGIAAYLRRHDLPPHPLLARGFPSIGCQPCTSRAAPGEPPRAGRWRGQDKTECGIHRPAPPRETSPMQKDPL